MKKQYIIIISVVAIVAIIAGVLILGGKKNNQNNNFNPQNIEESTIASLSVGNWVSVVAEKVDGNYTASMIMACDDKDSCQMNGSNQGDKKTPPSGNTSGDVPTPPTSGDSSTTPTGDMPTPPTNDSQNRGSMENKTMLSGTITEVNADSITLSLDTGETATILISDSTRINKR